MAMLPNKPWLFVSEAAKYLGISRMTIYRWIEAGELEVRGCRYFYRVSRLSLEKKLSQL